MNRVERWFLAGVILLSCILRFWHFVPFMEFLDDQGRDAIVAKRILKDGDFTLLGPGTSVGTMYLGPLYYYAMVPFLWLTYPSPVGPAYAVAGLGVLTVVFTYLLGKRIFGKRIAAIACVLMCVATPVVQLSRFSWQPNPAPFFGLLLFYAVWKVWKGAFRWWALVGLFFAVLLQLHYVSLTVLGPIGVCALELFIRNRKKKPLFWSHLRWMLCAGLIVLVSFAPLVAFDLRHQGIIRNGFLDFIKVQRGSQSRTIVDRFSHVLANTHGRGMFMLVEFWGLDKEQRVLNSMLLLAVWISALLSLVKLKRSELQQSSIVFLTGWIGLILLAVSIYEGNLLVHYLGFCFPLLAFFTAHVLSWWMRGRLSTVLLWSGIVLWCLVMIPKFWFWKGFSVGINEYQKVAEFVLSSLPKSGAYNIALLNDNREYKGNKFRYFLEVGGHVPKDQYSYTNLEYLVVFVENGENPLGSPVFEVQQFLQENQNEPRLLTERSFEGIVKAYIYQKK